MIRENSGRLTICRTPTKVIHTESMGVRWCFTHRGRAEFEWVVTATIEPSYYDPEGRVECTECGAIDGDCGFGSSRCNP